MKKIRYIAWIMVLVLVFGAFKCSSRQEKRAAQLADTYAYSLKGIHDFVDVAHAHGKIGDADYRTIMEDLLAANQGGLDLNRAIRGVAAGTGSVSQINVVIQAIENALTDGASHIKDAKTLEEVQLAIASVNTTLSAVEAVYAGGTK